MGVIGDFDNRYVTFDPHLEAKEIEVFKKWQEKDTSIKERKPLYWCSHCETALAEAEIGEAPQVPVYLCEVPCEKYHGLDRRA